MGARRQGTPSAVNASATHWAAFSHSAGSATRASATERKWTSVRSSSHARGRRESTAAATVVGVCEWVMGAEYPSS